MTARVVRKERNLVVCAPRSAPAVDPASDQMISDESNILERCTLRSIYFFLSYLRYRSLGATVERNRTRMHGIAITAKSGYRLIALETYARELRIPFSRVDRSSCGVAISTAPLRPSARIDCAASIVPSPLGPSSLDVARCSLSLHIPKKHARSFVSDTVDALHHAVADDRRVVARRVRALSLLYTRRLCWLCKRRVRLRDSQKSLAKRARRQAHRVASRATSAIQPMLRLAWHRCSPSSCPGSNLRFDRAEIARGWRSDLQIRDRYRNEHRASTRALIAAASLPLSRERIARAQSYYRLLISGKVDSRRSKLRIAREDRLFVRLIIRITNEPFPPPIAKFTFTYCHYA